MIPLRSRSDSFTFTPELSAIASGSNFSRCPSVRSRDDLITKFCTSMWERERRKRKLVLSDGQYLLAYEAISAAIVDAGKIDSREVESWLELYLGEDAKQLLAELPEDV